jgi:hypothetical protein
VLSSAAMSDGTGAAVPVRAIVFLALAAFASAATMRITDALLPQIASHFMVTTGAAGRVVTAFAVSYGLLQAVFGPVGDRLGKYRVVTVATVLSAFGAITCALAPTLDALTAARFLSGASAAATRIGNLTRAPQALRAGAGLDDGGEAWISCREEANSAPQSRPAHGRTSRWDRSDRPGDPWHVRSRRARSDPRRAVLTK